MRLFKIAILLLVISNKLFGQFSPVKFIDLPVIKWAACYNDNLVPEKYNLGECLLERLKKNEIKVSRPIYSDPQIAKYFAHKKIEYINIKQLEDFHPVKGNNRYDSLSHNKLEIEQILYITNGKIYSYVVWVSPKISLYTSTNVFIGVTDDFSAAFNFNYNFKSSPSDRIISLGTTDTKISLDSFPRKYVEGIVWDEHGRNPVGKFTGVKQ